MPGTATTFDSGLPLNTRVMLAALADLVGIHQVPTTRASQITVVRLMALTRSTHQRARDHADGIGLDAAAHAEDVVLADALVDVLLREDDGAPCVHTRRALRGALLVELATRFHRVGTDWPDAVHRALAAGNAERARADCPPDTD